MNRTIRFHAVLALTGLTAISCGGAQPAAEGPAAASAAAPAATGVSPATLPASAPGPALAWKDMNRDQRLEFMKSTVMPKMKAEFTAYDGKRYASFGCATCHGDAAMNGSFKMPNGKLPKIPSDMAGFKKVMEASPDAAKFMSMKVVPQMAALLGEQPFDPSTGKGFGCHACHASDK